MIDIKEMALSIINKYGTSNQLKHLSGEYYELVESILNVDPIEHITEEIADMIAILKTIQYKYNIDDDSIDNVIKEKYTREMRRINENN